MKTDQLFLPLKFNYGGEQRLIFKESGERKTELLTKILDNEKAGYKKINFSTEKIKDAISGDETEGEKKREFTVNKGDTLSGRMAKEFFTSTKTNDAEAFKSLNKEQQSIILNIVLKLEKAGMRTWHILPKDKFTFVFKNGSVKAILELKTKDGVMKQEIDLTQDAEIESVKDRTRFYLEAEKKEHATSAHAHMRTKTKGNNEQLKQALKEQNLSKAMKALGQDQSLKGRRKFLQENTNILAKINEYLKTDGKTEIKDIEKDYRGTMEQNLAFVKALNDEQGNLKTEENKSGATIIKEEGTPVVLKDQRKDKDGEAKENADLTKVKEQLKKSNEALVKCEEMVKAMKVQVEIKSNDPNYTVAIAETDVNKYNEAITNAEAKLNDIIPHINADIRLSLTKKNKNDLVTQFDAITTNGKLELVARIKEIHNFYKTNEAVILGTEEGKKETLDPKKEVQAAFDKLGLSVQSGIIVNVEFLNNDKNFVVSLEFKSSEGNQTVGGVTIKKDGSAILNGGNFKIENNTIIYKAPEKKEKVETATVLTEEARRQKIVSEIAEGEGLLKSFGIGIRPDGSTLEVPKGYSIDKGTPLAETTFLDFCYIGDTTKNAGVRFEKVDDSTLKIVTDEIGKDATSINEAKTTTCLVKKKG